MKLIGSGAGDGVQNAAAATSIFRPIVCAENLNLENGVRPQLHSRRAERQAVLRIHDVRSVQQIAVVSVTAAGKGQICTGNSSGCGGRRGIRYSGVERDQLRVTAAVEGHPNQQGLIDETGFSAGGTFCGALFAVGGAFFSVLRHQLPYGQGKWQCEKSKSDNQSP